jgi:hypothetical protein
MSSVTSKNAKPAIALRLKTAVVECLTEGFAIQLRMRPPRNPFSM